MNFDILLAFSLFFVFAATVPGEAHDLEGIKRFPHYVTIANKNSLGGYNCSGSIIGDKWILTTLYCVNGNSFTVYFLMDNINHPWRSFSLSLDDSAVIPYPTGFDNIALIKLPVTLEFSDLLKPIPYHGWDGDYDRIYNGFAVMPGFNTATTTTLTYGMYRVLCRRECRNNLGVYFDEFMEICASDWNKNNRVLTSGNAGSGLIQGWPRAPRLIGILSEPIYPGGGWDRALVFVRLSKYRNWIDEVIKPFTTTSSSTTTPTTTSTTSTTTPTTSTTTTIRPPPATEPP